MPTNTISPTVAMAEILSFLSPSVRGSHFMPPSVERKIPLSSRARYIVIGACATSGMMSPIAYPLGREFIEFHVSPLSSEVNIVSAETI